MRLKRKKPKQTNKRKNNKRTAGAYVGETKLDEYVKLQFFRVLFLFLCLLILTDAMWVQIVCQTACLTSATHGTFSHVLLS